ncbi:MAG TPA: enoyl-CoA hydratase-related protein [Candidatus Limnocylindria bacterium]|jgi:crotonobetainyl-CoA hydratase|nr:enoyl-CoA hydratase-related protein [Candidatus Limnocylindria bacterium]
MSEIRYELADHVARVTIDRPRVLNALSPAAEDELREIWARVEDDRSVWVVVVTGAGDRAFCVGADMSAQETGATGLEYWARERPGGFGGLALRRTLNVPVIAAVNGHAIGGGLEMVLGCDIVVAADGARFGLSEPRVGRIPLDGGVIQLVRQLPYRLAMSMLLTGQQISAAEACRYGLINEVVPREEFAATVQRWVDEVLACAPLSLRAIKAMVLGTEAMRVEDATRMRFPSLVEALGSDDAAEGVQAFREKRKPVWRAS